MDRLTFHHSVVELPSGELVACIYCWFQEDSIPFLTDPPAPEHGNYGAFSTDQSETCGQLTHLPIEFHADAERSTCYTGLREVESGKLLVTFDIGWWRTPIRYIGQRFVWVRRAS